ncbi:ATP-dependent RNA helicase DEAH13 isoform X1 [Cucumis melo]|uniref:RNA helicase n=4 Tax=Cucumis melo TaxID=3656 RepID=A0A1S3BSH7_CUCME|nr:ATP-dependent RNA helicase DEAH13 isoform X1 [Cucumis melo]XP_050943406.1 ATP-dependent RNA helicase DEAH13 isoform X1 [Cucumis melo]XP_050943408.1 ATP-dependent RNA helicase DEAH13 isoform X1 [Cucumis melo]XP_050943412.1 ATP-dependent RNA helicase DEAH13 isoform X1 [Cucumis melo]XP_050943414.1 ATP-dependent RNA helicase DEAH13 isoform X1 [Cucumis melo]XP_050943419.1 ATP-dependent RNA helicase DEAH13 isoform X1 [Cucumis melo]
MEDLVNDQLDCGKGSWSLDGGGSNQVMLYGSKKSDKKRKNTNKGCKGIQLNKKPKLSKSQKRKIMKLEEEKEKSLLLSKSLETLEKYKISDDAFLLLRSSVNIGKDETRLEKRSRDIQFSKVGIEVPGNDQQLDRTSSDISQYESHCGSLDISPCHQLSANADEDDPFVAEKEVTCGLDSFKDLDEVEKTGAALLEDERDLSGTMCAVGGFKGPEITDKEDGIPKVEICTTSNPLPEMRLLSKPIVVPVSRPCEVEDKRKDLPIVMMEQEIMEAINENPIVIICGETGCGKTTQVPQFLYEAGFGSSQSSHQRGAIGVTQPRRVAVLATAKRVAYELGVRLGKEVGFQVRYDKKIGDSSSIKFMTDGILLREVQHDFLLKRYSVLILDEAHERSMNTDILIGMLSRVVKLRQDLHMKQRQIILSGGKISLEDMIFPLKLVLMSATLRVEDFISGGRLFHVSPPIIEVPTRQFPVTVHFSKRTDIVDYIGQAYKKVLAIHKKLPPGGILVFVTGQREVENLCKKLREASKKLMKKTSERNGENNNGIVETNSIQNLDMNEINEAFEDREFSIEQTDRFSSFDKDEFDINDDVSDASYNSGSDSELEFNEDAMSDETDGHLTDVIMDDASMSSLKAAFDALDRKNALDLDKRQVDHTTDEDLSSKQCVSARLKENVEFGFPVGALHVLPLYAMLPAAAQLRVFEEVKEGERLVVVATNVAETSLTIPGIKYVVDTGREKVKTYNSSNGIENYEVQWISKASAAQRAGRAGRTGPGHCYRLYSSAVFSNTLPDFSLAEIAKIPVDGVVLLMKSMGISKVVNFPFPTPPETSAVLEAESCLKALEALDSGGRLTALGKAMAQYPLSPRHSRMLLTVIQIMKNLKNYDRANLVLAYSVASAAALSTSNPFVMMFEGSQMKDELEQNDRSFELGDTKTEEKVEKSLKKKLKEAGKLSREKFSDHSSDALTVAYALQCFELSETPVAFCNNYTLHLKTMQEMSKLRKQLLKLVFNHSRSSIAESDFSWTNGALEDVEAMWRVPSNKHPLSLKEKEIIGQAICAGWPDRVAKRIREISKSVEADRKERAGKYQACMVKENVFVNRGSSVSRSAPKFLVYNELLRTKRPYMHGLTSVQPDWLVKYASSLCAFSAPLTDPKPYYDSQNDTVYSWVAPTFGPHLWELPLHNVPIKDNAQGVAVFACALLKGKVLPCLTSVREFMAARPGSILRPEALGQKRVGNLLSRLKSKKINSRATLRAVWKDNPYELHSEILDWFQKSYHSHFEDLWSQMLCEVQLPQKRLIKKLGRAKEKKIKN